MQSDTACCFGSELVLLFRAEYQRARTQQAPGDFEQALPHLESERRPAALGATAASPGHPWIEQLV
jgi:hypothetical protein